MQAQAENRVAYEEMYDRCEDRREMWYGALDLCPSRAIQALRLLCPLYLAQYIAAPPLR